uniref:Uncharacterized protein n=1 Tax=Triticum urartu TaxID=4572 RepID=A0A8R7QSE2_TRIUA
ARVFVLLFLPKLKLKRCACQTSESMYAENTSTYSKNRGKARYARPEEMPNKIKGLKGRVRRDKQGSKDSY